VAHDAVYILTLQLDSGNFERLQSLRQRHFPAERNWIPAHLSLFHTLSIEQVSRLDAAWDNLGRRPVLPLAFARLMSLGRGVAIGVDSPALDEFRAHMMQTLEGPFTRQDMAPYRAHVTLQNKVEPAAARQLLDELRADFTPWSGTGDGVLVWRYMGGPWELDATLPFRQ